MWKLLLILVLLIYLLNKISVVVLRAFGRPQAPPSNRANQDNINGNGPSTGPGQGPKRGSIKGGEYVDYEEVK